MVLYAHDFSCMSIHIASFCVMYLTCIFSHVSEVQCPAGAHASVPRVSRILQPAGIYESQGEPGVHCRTTVMYMKIYVYSTLAARLVVKDEKIENPDPIHHTN